MGFFSHFDKWYWQNVNPSQYISISLGRVLPAISPLWWMTPAFCQQQKMSLKRRPICRSERRLVHPCHWKSPRSILSTPYIPLSLCSSVLSVLSVCLYLVHIPTIYPPYIYQSCKTKTGGKPASSVRSDCLRLPSLQCDQGFQTSCWTPTASSSQKTNTIEMQTLSKHLKGRNMFFTRFCPSQPF